MPLRNYDVDNKEKVSPYFYSVFLHSDRELESRRRIVNRLTCLLQDGLEDLMEELKDRKGLVLRIRTDFGSGENVFEEVDMKLVQACIFVIVEVVCYPDSVIEVKPSSFFSEEILHKAFSVVEKYNYTLVVKAF